MVFLRSDLSGNGRLLVVAVTALTVVLLFALGLDHDLTLHWIKMQRDDLGAIYAVHPAIFIVCFIATQAVALALCVPGAMLVPGLSAGAIFGVPFGVFVVLTAVTLGDSLGFLAARHLFRSWAERWLDRRMDRLDSEIERNGAFYLLSMRLFPIVPFFAVNISLGLTRMPLLLFAPVSFVGLVPATLFYVSAGRELGSIQKAADIYSPLVLGYFGVLALVPLVIRFFLQRDSR